MSKKGGGTKHDKGKAPLDLIPYESLEEIAQFLEQGRLKYNSWNWANGLSYSRLIAASLRHIHQFNDGIDEDEETKTLHVANAACNLLFLIWMHKNRPDMDDRGMKKVKNGIRKAKKKSS